MHDRKGFTIMRCDNCGKVFDINPAAGKSEMASRQGADVIATKTATLVDSKKNSSLIFIMECPFCHNMKSGIINYKNLLDLPQTEGKVGFGIRGGCFREGNFGRSVARLRE